MASPRIIVIGASAGGFEALQTLVAALPPDLPAAIFIVWHMAPEVRGVLPHVLNRLGTLPASNAADGEEIQAGRIYIAPPDHHMLLESNRIRITRGPKENRFRPAVDPLFRSAAYSHGREVIGIVLSGALDDGTSGLWTVKHRGGIAIVQDPKDAAVSSMPESASRAVDVDYSVPVSEMGALLARLCTAPENPEQPPIHINMEENKRTEAEIRAAMDNGSGAVETMLHGVFSPYACPECHGVLTALQEGGRIRFRCHTGHAYSTDALLSEITENIGDSIWNAIRGVEESVMLLNHVGDHCAEQNQPGLAASYFRKAAGAAARLKILKEAVIANETLSRDRIAEETDGP